MNPYPGSVRIQLLCPHFEPDLSAATGMLMTGLMRALHERGHRVDVVTSLPWYANHEVEAEWRGRPWRSEEGPLGSVVRVFPFPTEKTNIPARALGFFGFSAMVAASAHTLGRPDVVMGLSPPIFLGDAAWTIAKRHDVPFVFNVQDIFPDVAIELGAITNQRLIDAMHRHERSVYARADSVTVLSEDQADNVRAKIAEPDRSKVSIIRNFADVDSIRPLDRQTNERRRLGLDDKLVVQYSGNVGMSQPFDLIMAAADRFAHRPDVHFVINGEGAARPLVDGWAAERANVTVTDFVGPGQVADVLGTADLHLIPLKAGLARSSTPSKLYGILASGRPSLASIDQGSEVWNTLAEADAGCSVEPGDAEGFFATMASMLDDPEGLQVQGRNGRRYVENRLSPRSQAVAYEELFEQLIRRHAAS